MKSLALTIQGTPIDAPPQIPQGGSDTLNMILGRGLMIIFAVAVLFALVVLIRGGIEWSASGGDKQKIEQSRLRIIYGIIGLVLVILSFFIVNFITGLFGIGAF